MSEPLVSIVLPVFNAGETIAEAVESCLRQSMESFELVVLLDGCSDRSGEIVESYGAAPTGDALLAGAAFWAFAAAIDACRTGEVTQPCVEEGRIDAWNGAGLHPSGDNAGCRVVVGLDDKGFRRVFPLEPGRFSCPDDL